MMTKAAKLEERLADDVLAERATSGSAAAFAQLVERHGDAVYAIATNLCRSLDDAERTVQDAFLTAWRDFGFFPAGARFTTWLYRIATRIALADGARGRRRRDEQADITAPLRGVLDCMDDRTRAAFVLCDLVELCAEETAVILDLPPPTVRREAHRARLLLRAFIDRL